MFIGAFSDFGFLNLRCSTGKFNANIPKFKNIQNLKHFWSQLFWIMATQPIFQNRDQEVKDLCPTTDSPHLVMIDSWQCTFKTAHAKVQRCALNVVHFLAWCSLCKQSLHVSHDPHAAWTGFMLHSSYNISFQTTHLWGHCWWEKCPKFNRFSLLLSWDSHASQSLHRGSDHTVPLSQMPTSW